jgi:hypothetical protein
MPGTPKILAQRILHVRWIANQQGKDAQATKHHGWQDNQKDTGQAARLMGHD